MFAETCMSEREQDRNVAQASTDSHTIASTSSSADDPAALSNDAREDKAQAERQKCFWGY